MAVVNTGSNLHRQHFYCLDVDVRPAKAYVGDKLYVIDTGEEAIWDGEKWVVANPVPVADGIGGIASGGTNISLIDETKNVGLDFYNNYIIVMNIEGAQCIRTITGCGGDTFSFATLGDAVQAAAGLVGDDGSGEKTITLKVVQPGLGGNDYQLQIVEGDGDSEDPLEVIVEDKFITIKSALNEGGDPVKVKSDDIKDEIDNGVLQGILETSNDYSDSVEFEFMEEPISFTGGIDDFEVKIGSPYTIQKP